MTTTETSTPSRTPAPRSGDRPLKMLVGAVHLTLALLLVQAVLAGIFVSDTYEGGGGVGVVTAHGVVADSIWVIALLAAGLSVVRLRSRSTVLVGLTTAYFVLALIETVIGHLISDASLLGISGNRNGLIAAHIPLAIVLFALGGYIATHASGMVQESSSQPAD